MKGSIIGEADGATEIRGTCSFVKNLGTQHRAEMGRKKRDEVSKVQQDANVPGVS